LSVGYDTSVLVNTLIIGYKNSLCSVCRDWWCSYTCL